MAKTVLHYIHLFLLHFWQHFHTKLIILGVIILLVGLFYYIGVTDESSYLWVNIISEDLN